MLPIIGRAVGQEIERKCSTYVEPFVGGGAVLFWLCERFLSGGERNLRNLVINDFNADLIGAYRTVKSNVAELIDVLGEIEAKFRESPGDGTAFYHERRDEFNSRDQGATRQSALLIYLNHTCYNGLYRVNADNEFNVPYGKRKDVTILDRDVLLADAEALRHVKVMEPGDFARAGAGLADQRKAFYYFDPPYRPLSRTSSFSNYTRLGFDDAEQRRLAGHCTRLAAEGASILVSNSDTADTFYESNYPAVSGFAISRITATRMVNSKATRRGKVGEVLISNYVVREIG